VRYFWVFAHLLGFVLWLGAGAAGMAMSIASRREPRENLGVVARQLATVYRLVMLPGVLLTLASGLILTLMIYGSADQALRVSHWLMAMQGIGLVAGVIVLAFLIPVASRAALVDPTGPQGPAFDALRGRARMLGMISGILALLALVTGAAMRP